MANTFTLLMVLLLVSFLIKLENGLLTFNKWDLDKTLIN